MYATVTNLIVEFIYKNRKYSYLKKKKLFFQIYMHTDFGRVTISGKNPGVVSFTNQIVHQQTQKYCMSN